MNSGPPACVGQGDEGQKFCLQHAECLHVGFCWLYLYSLHPLPPCGLCHPLCSVGAPASASEGMALRTLPHLPCAQVTLQPGRWSHLCFTYQSSTATLALYTDGVPGPKVQRPGLGPVEARNSLYFGQEPGQAFCANRDIVTLCLSNVRMWSACRSPDQVRVCVCARLNPHLCTVLPRSSG